MVDKAVSEAASAMARAKWARKTKQERHQVALDLNEFRWADYRRRLAQSDQSQSSTKPVRSKRAKSKQDKTGDGR